MTHTADDHEAHRARNTVGQACMVLLVGVLALVVLPYLLNGDKSLSDVSVFTGMIVVGVWLAQGVPLMIVFMVGHELLHASHVKLKRWLDSKFPSLAEDDTPS